MQLPPGKKIYFLSDFHLGAPNHATSLVREKHIVAFLENIRKDAAIIFIVGDLFDFWFEYRTVVPKGYTRILGKLAELRDSGIDIHFFTGNHDMWMSGYFEQELGIPVYHEPKVFQWNGKKFYIGHGDGLGPGDHGYKFIKKIFRNPVCKWLFGILPPAIGVGLANYLSRRSRAVTGQIDEKFLGEDKEWLIIYCKEILSKEFYDYFIFGHRHLPIDFSLPVSGDGRQRGGGQQTADDGQRTGGERQGTNKGRKGTGEGRQGADTDEGAQTTDGDQYRISRYINLGDWIRYDTYAVFDGEQLSLLTDRPDMTGKIVRGTARQTPGSQK